MYLLSLSLVAILGDEGPVDSIDKKRLLLKLISKFGQTLRQITSGEYRDSFTQETEELRIKYIIEEIIKVLYSLTHSLTHSLTYSLIVNAIKFITKSPQLQW
jgi:hypothetical protein